MPQENLPKMPFIAVFAGFFSVLSAAWSKTSFGLTLLRLCQGWARWLIWFIIITVNLILGTAMLLMWVKCHPFAKIWDPELDGWCIDPNKIVLFYQVSAGECPFPPCRVLAWLTRPRRFAGWSGSADIVLALLPWTILFGMRKSLNTKERLGVAVAMSMGIV